MLAGVQRGESPIVVAVRRMNWIHGVCVRVLSDSEPHALGETDSPQHGVRIGGRDVDVLPGGVRGPSDSLMKQFSEPPGTPRGHRSVSKALGGLYWSPDRELTHRGRRRPYRGL